MINSKESNAVLFNHQGAIPGHMKFELSTFFWGAVILLTGASLFFTIRVTSFKKGLNIDAGTISISSGERAAVIKIIDGDEVSVQSGNSRFVIRILGIRSFDPTINDPQLQNAGQLASNFLEEKILKQEIEIRFEKRLLDKKKRLLAHLFAGGEDIGLLMVSQGFTLTYRRYPFPAMDRYIEMENRARKRKRGFWSNPAVRKRSDQLIQLWKKQRREAAD